MRGKPRTDDWTMLGNVGSEGYNKQLKGQMRRRSSYKSAGCLRRLRRTLLRGRRMKETGRGEGGGGGEKIVGRRSPHACGDRSSEGLGTPYG